MTQNHIGDDARGVERYLTGVEDGDREMQTSPGLRFLEGIEKVPDTHFLNSELRDSGALSTAILSSEFSRILTPQDKNDEPASVPLERIRAKRVAEGDKKKERPSRPLRLRGERQVRKDAKSAENRTTYDDPLQTDLHFLQSNPSHHSKRDILTNTNLDPTAWPTLAPQLNNHPRIHRTGQKRSTSYEWRAA